MKLLSCNSGQFSTPTPLLIMNILRREPCLIFLFHTEFAGWTENPQKYLLTCCVRYKIHYAMINMDPHCASMVVFQRKIKLRSDFSVDPAAFNTSKTVLQAPCHLRRRSFLEACSWVTGGFVWAQIGALVCAKLAPSHPRCGVGGFSPVSDTHQYNSTETLDVCVTVTILFSPLETINKTPQSSEKNGDLQELPYEVVWFIFFYLQQALMTAFGCLFVNENPKMDVKK